MGFGGAGGRLVDLGERERGKQFEAARALLFRDGDGGLDASSAGAGLAGSRLSSDFAADAMQFGFECAMVPVRSTSPTPSIEDGDGAVDISGTGFGFGQHDLETRRVED